MFDSIVGKTVNVDATGGPYVLRPKCAPPVLSERSKGSEPRRFDYTFVHRNLPAGSGMGIKRANLKCAAVSAVVFVVFFLDASASLAQMKTPHHSGSAASAAAATSRFAKRVDTL